MLRVTQTPSNEFPINLHQRMCKSTDPLASIRKWGLAGMLLQLAGHSFPGRRVDIGEVGKRDKHFEQGQQITL